MWQAITWRLQLDGDVVVDTDEYAHGQCGDEIHSNEQPFAEQILHLLEFLLDGNTVLRNLAGGRYFPIKEETEQKAGYSDSPYGLLPAAPSGEQ